MYGSTTTTILFERLQRGYEGMADYVAAINIVARAAVKQPIVVDLRLTSKIPYQLRYISIC